MQRVPICYVWLLLVCYVENERKCHLPLINNAKRRSEKRQSEQQYFVFLALLYSSDEHTYVCIVMFDMTWSLVHSAPPPPTTNLK